MNIKIHNMTENDWEDVRSIYSEGIEEGKSTFQTTVPSYNEWNSRHLPDCRYVATIDSCVIGWIAISPTSSRDVYKGVAEVSIYISYQYQHMGVGKMLLQHLCHESEEKASCIL